MEEIDAFTEARVAPLSEEQEQLWALYRLESPTSADNEYTAVTLRGPLDVSILRESLHAVIQRHETWRTVFVIRNGQPVQVVLSGGRCEWSAADLREAAEAQREAGARRLAQQQISRPFDLACGPLLRALLVQLGEQHHQLLLTWHRIVADQTSVTQVTLPELGELYDARAQRRAEKLDPVESQHADYAIWQRRQRPDSERLSGLRFWIEHLAGAPAVLELPADHGRNGQLGYRGQAQSFTLGAELSAGLRELSKREQVSLRMTLTAAFETLLFRYTGQEDLLFGLSVPKHRPGPASRTTGLFTSTLVVRADLAGEPSVRELLERTRTASEAALGHEDVPLHAIVREMQPERSPDHHPLVQVLLMVEPEPPTLPAGWRLEPADIRPPTSRFDLCVEVEERADGLTGRFISRSDLFEPETIGRMIGHWRMLLEAMTVQPWLPVRQLPMLTEPETEQILREWSAGGELAPGPDIVELIAEQARVRPDEVAVVCGAEQLSYRELDRRASRLARHLRALGVAAEDPVGILLERSPDHVVALIAILRAGGAFVPLDPEAPPERTRYVVQDTRMPLLLTQERWRDTVAPMGAKIVSLDGDRAAIEELSADEPDEQQRAEQLAYVVYTSGSTGRPKGVMVERGALAAHCRAMIGEYQLGPADRVLQFSQYSADASLEQILPALGAGARLVMRGPEIWSSRELLEELKSQQVTVMNMSPMHWQQVVREWARQPAELAGLPLRLLILGGERLAASAVREWHDLGLPGVRLLNAYGPTEATITATIADVGHESEPITIGRPLPGRTVYILDDGGRPVPTGVLGELHIGGPLLARGYLNQPALTKERFVHDPFGHQPGGRLYLTGDLVRYRPDGRIEYAGRNDEQVKIRGYRIELGEVEAVLARHPEVSQAVVVAQGDGGDKELVAFAVARTGAPLPMKELRGYLDSQLPRHMRPAIIEQLAELPRLATGKPDRRRLPKLEHAKRPDDAPYVPARDLAEQQLVQFFEELLEPRPIGIKDNFFHLGGHSLLAAQLVDRIERGCGKKLALSTLFANPTVEQLAEALQDGTEVTGGKKVRLQPVQVSGSRTPFFFLHGDWTGGAFYCFSLARACGPDQPFYALETYRFSARERVPTLETIAAAHIEAMREVQPQGPYRIGGFCNGGLLAYEMACQLENIGEQVEFLGLIDPSPPVQSSILRTACDTAQAATRTGSARQADLYLRVRHAERHVYRRLRPRAARVRDFAQLLAIEPSLGAMFPPWDALYRDYIGVLSWSAAGYKAGTYRGPITFFWAREEPTIARTWQPVNRRRAAGIEVHAIPGTHRSAVTEHIQDLAKILAACLARAGHEAGQFPGRRAAANQ